MRKNLDAVRASKWYQLFLIWHFLAILFSLVIGIADRDFSLFLSLVIWTIIAIIAYYLEPPFFVLTAFGLAALEELLVYQLGGGLQGDAQSLFHDYINSLPVFLGIIIGWYLVLRRYKVSEAQLYLLGGIHAAFVELFFQGIIFDPVLLFLLGGPVFFIYGTIVVAPKRPQGEKEFGVLAMISAIIVVLIFLLFGAIVADNLNTIFGY